MKGWLADLLSPVNSITMNLSIGPFTADTERSSAVSKILVRNFELFGDDKP